VGQANEQRARFDLGELATEVVLSLKPSFGKHGIGFELGLEPALEMDSYPRALARILQQLARNAHVHAFGEGGAGGTIRVRAAQAGDGRLLLECSDNGRGIPADKLARVFDPFFTTRMGSGTGGLGLHVVHNLLSNVLGGEISVDSHPGATCFRIMLPRQAPELAS